MFRPASFTSPATMGMLFQPSNAQSAASIAAPNAENPLQFAAPAGARKFPHVAVGAKKNTPTTMAAMPTTLASVSKD